MKKHFRTLLCLMLLICTVIALGVTVFGATTISGNLSRGGVAYELSEDRSYYMVAGYSEHMSSVTILTDIDGIPVTEIKESAFQNNEYINKVIIPYSITKIEKSAFRNCKNLTEVALPDNLTCLPVECFYECSMLTKITLPSELISIGDDCFGNCTMLGKVKIPASVTEIGHDAFLNCEQLLLDVSENAYAADYAKIENLNTDFKNSTAYFLIIVGGCVLVALIFIILISIPLKKHIKKYPNHDPLIYIEKFFSAIGKGLTFIYESIKKGILFVAGKIILLFEITGKKINKKRYEIKARKEVKNEENTGEKNN